MSRDSGKMPIIQVWIETPVDYLTIRDGQREALIDTLLTVKGVIEVEHYSKINLCCSISADSDSGAFCELSAIRSRVETVFRSFHVWKEG